MNSANTITSAIGISTVSMSYPYENSFNFLCAYVYISLWLMVIQ